jgi:dCTP deaminase
VILTGNEIRLEIQRGGITIDPFDETSINPNSVNYRLGPRLKLFEVGDRTNEHRFRDVEIPSDGYVLEPGRTYLGHTLERIGSDRFAMSLIGRSSIGRLGLFLQASANLGHVASSHCWTLELVAAKRIRVHAGDVIGQVSFWETFGPVSPYSGYFGGFDNPQESPMGSPGSARRHPEA